MKKRPAAGPPGLAVPGEHNAPSGLGESARLMVLAGPAIGLPMFPIDTDLGGLLARARPAA